MRDVKALFAFGVTMFFAVFLALWLASYTVVFDVKIFGPLELHSVPAGEGVIQRGTGQLG